MAIRSMPNTNTYRDGHKRIFGDTRPPKSARCPECERVPCDPKFIHALKAPETSQRACEIVSELSKRLESRFAQTETCVPCNKEHPRGEPCPNCGRKLLLG